MAQFRIPGPLRRLSEGQTTVDVDAADLGTAIDALDAVITVTGAVTRATGKYSNLSSLPRIVPTR